VLVLALAAHLQEGKAAQGANLSSAARAYLRLVEGIVAAAVVTASPLIVQYLSSLAQPWCSCASMVWSQMTSSV
jgi:hypothetical protein